MEDFNRSGKQNSGKILQTFSSVMLSKKCILYYKPAHVYIHTYVCVYMYVCTYIIKFYTHKMLSLLSVIEVIFKC